MNIMAAFFDEKSSDVNWPSGRVHFDFLLVIISKASFSVLSVVFISPTNAAPKFLLKLEIHNYFNI